MSGAKRGWGGEGRTRECMFLDTSLLAQTKGGGEGGGGVLLDCNYFRCKAVVKQ
jgi:hypothetical protein